MDALIDFMRQMPEAIGFPPSWFFGLLAGIFIRRWWIAVPVAGILSPVANILLSRATSDAEPRVVWLDALLFATSAMVIALVAWALTRGFKRIRRTAQARQ